MGVRSARIRRAALKQVLSFVLAILLALCVGLALLAFDIYSACREKLFEIRLGELRSSVALKIGRAGEASGRREGVQE